MKLFASALLFSTVFATVPISAQEDQGCFMRDVSGRWINLASICSSAPTD